MSMKERAAYLKGMAEGMKLSSDKDVEKLLKEVIDVIDELSEFVDDIDEDLDVFSEQLDAVDEDLADLEEVVYEGMDDCCCDDCEGLYEVECPACGEVFTIDDEIYDEGSIECPGCGETIEFEGLCDCDDCADED